MNDEARGHENRLSPVDRLGGFSDEEKKSVVAQSRPSAVLIHETIRAEGESELDRPASALLASGFAAGLSLGFSLVAGGLLQSALPDTRWRPLIVSLGYMVGFVVVVLGRQQLFTENTLTPILSLLYRKDWMTVGRVARLWCLVLVANVFRTWLVANVLAYGTTFGDDVQSAFAAISRSSMASPFGTTVLKGILRDG